MSTNIDKVLQKKFEEELIESFQETGIGIRGAVRVKDAGSAKKVQFQVLDQMQAQKRGAIQTPLNTQNVDYTPKVATVEDYYVSEMTDIFKENQVSFDERQAFISTMTMALERQLDQIVINEFINDTLITKTVAANHTGTSSNLLPSSFTEAAKTLGSAVPDMDRHALVHDNGFYPFLNNDDVKNIEISTHKALAEGMLPAYSGFSIHKIGDRREGGLDVASSIRQNWFWQKMSVGLAINMEPQIFIDWEPSFAAHRVTAMMSGGAVVVQPDGVVEVKTDES